MFYSECQQRRDRRRRRRRRSEPSIGVGTQTWQVARIGVGAEAASTTQSYRICFLAVSITQHADNTTYNSIHMKV